MKILVLLGTQVISPQKNHLLDAGDKPLNNSDGCLNAGLSRPYSPFGKKGMKPFCWGIPAPFEGTTPSKENLLSLHTSTTGRW